MTQGPIATSFPVFEPLMARSWRRVWNGAKHGLTPDRKGAPAVHSLEVASLRESLFALSRVGGASAPVLRTPPELYSAKDEGARCPCGRRTALFEPWGHELHGRQSTGPPRRARSTIGRAVAARFGFAASRHRVAPTGPWGSGGAGRGEAPIAAAEGADAGGPVSSLMRCAPPRWPRPPARVAVIPRGARRSAGFSARPLPGGPGGGAVLDGRDIGTVICPEAEVKLFVHRQRRGARRAAVERGENFWRLGSKRISQPCWPMCASATPAIPSAPPHRCWPRSDALTLEYQHDGRGAGRGGGDRRRGEPPSGADSASLR